MAEGIFLPEQAQIPGVSPELLRKAVLRVQPCTWLRLDLVPTREEAFARYRVESNPDGSELWHRFFTPGDLARAEDPEFATAMVSHEFAQLVRQGASFPQTVRLAGGGTGFAIDGAGHVMTNYHLVTSELGQTLCRTLRVEGAERVWLIAHPPEERALHTDERGMGHLREDTALLRVEPPPSAWLTLSSRPVSVGEPVWMAGFPLRTARDPEALQRVGYTDADGSLRVTRGQILECDADYLVTDLDGSMGNSGSPLFGEDGQVIGIFSRASGGGPRNAVAYGHLRRVAVRSRLLLQLTELGSSSGNAAI